MLLFYYAFCFFGTLIFLIYKSIKQYKETKQEEYIIRNKCNISYTEEIPPYIQDKLSAYDSIIETNTRLLFMMDYQYEKEKDYIKKQKILTKQAELQLKISNAAEKADKLRDKYNILE